MITERRMYMLFNKKSFEVYKKRVNDFDYQFTQRKKQPRERDWRPLRFAIRDYVIGFLVLRHQSKENIIEVDVFMTTDPEWLQGYSGTRMAALSILCDGYKCGSTIGIKFTKNVENGFIPLALHTMADDLGVELKHITEGFITPKESRMLFLALTGFSTEATKRIMELSVLNLITPERICYLVHHGIWTLEEMESILLGCHCPELILNGKANIEDYLFYADVLFRTRTVMMGGFLDRKMLLKEVYEGEEFVDVEANDRDLNINFDSRYFAKVYTTNEDTPVPWVDGKENWIIPKGERIVVAIRGYDWPDLHNNLQRDVEMCKQLFKSYADDIPTSLFVMVPRDVENSTQTEYMKKYVSELEEIGVFLMVCPYLLADIDQKVQEKLQKIQLVRHDIISRKSTGARKKVTQLPSDFNETRLTFVSVPKELEEGMVKLPRLINQALYDEKELANNVNRKVVELRHHRVMDRIEYLGKIALLDPKAKKFVCYSSLLNQISLIANHKPETLRRLRLTKTIYPEDQLNKIIRELTQERYPFEIIPFLEKAMKNQQNVIVILDQNNKDERMIEKKSLEENKLEILFEKQTVCDEIIDYSDKTDDQVTMEKMWKAINASGTNQINMVNLGELPHMQISRVLNTFTYDDLKGDNKEVLINIVYTDGSQARPFPIFRLKKRNDTEMESFRKNEPIKIGMLSCRHPELNRIIDRYWLRNIDMKMAGSSSAEKDEFSYETTKEKLAEILEKKQPTRMYFYQTGFPPVVIGFYRAVTEFLIETQGKLPYLEIIPMIYDRHDDKYYPEKTWC